MKKFMLMTAVVALTIGSMANQADAFWGCFARRCCYAPPCPTYYCAVPVCGPCGPAYAYAPCSYQQYSAAYQSYYQSYYARANYYRPTYASSPYAYRSSYAYGLPNGYRSQNVSLNLSKLLSTPVSTSTAAVYPATATTAAVARPTLVPPTSAAAVSTASAATATQK